MCPSLLRPFVSWTTLVVTTAIFVAACDQASSTGAPPARSFAHLARTWKSPEVSVSHLHSVSAESACILSELPIEATPAPIHASNVVPAAVPSNTAAEVPAGPPRPIEIPWSAGGDGVADSVDEGSDPEGSRPVRLPGRVRTLAPKGDSPYPDGVRPGPCCALHPKQCAEFMASAKIDGTLASRAVESMRLRAMPFGKPAH
jgi:hypothetical protein